MPDPNRSHDWPKAGACLFGPWTNDQPRRGLQKPTQYRTCVHPACKAVERREHPNA